MAHNIYTPQTAARSALAALRTQTVLPRLVNRAYSGDFVSGVGQTVNVITSISTATSANYYTPANRTARTPITFDDLTQSFVPVTIDTQVYKAVRLPDDFATFTLTQVEQQVIVPLATRVVDGLSLGLTQKVIATATNSAIDTIAADGSNALTVIAQARSLLNKRGVEQANRVLVVSSDIALKLITLPAFRDFSQSNTGDTLREATIGRVYGFDVVEDFTFPANTAVAFHPDAFTLVVKPSAIPAGAGEAAIVSEDGFSLRFLRHYNPTQLEDQAVLDTFVGSAVLDANRAVRIQSA